MNSINRVAVQAAVNGIPVDDVRALIAAVEADPAAGMTRWKVATMWQGQARSMSRVEGFEIGGGGDNPRLAGGDLFSDGLARRDGATSALQSPGLDLVGGVAGGHGLRPRLQDVDPAVDAVLGPLDIHGRGSAGSA